MKYNLFVNYYIDKNEQRQKELDFCISQNIHNPHITNIVIIANQTDYEILISKHNHVKIVPYINEERPTYNHYFQLTRKMFNETDNINVICNSDMIIPYDECLSLCPLYLSTNANCLALSRWDASQMDNYTINAALFDRADSQDTWIFVGGVPNIPHADFTMGVPGCDNSIAHLLSSVGYNVINAAKSLKTYHIHLSNIRNYVGGDVINRVPPPYKLIPTTF